MKTLLTANLTTKKALLGGTEWEPPTLTFGESITLALRFAQEVEGATVEPVLTVNALKAAIGVLDARPDSGEWALQCGAGAQTVSNTTATVPHDCTPQQLAAAINAKAAVVTAYGSAVAEKADGSWTIVFGAGAVQVPLTVRDNTLWPVSSGQIGAYQVDGVWRHEVRLVQAPVAFTSDSEAILPDPPSVTRIVTGSTTGGFTVNEVQALYMPPDFRASYVLRQGATLRTYELSRADGAAEVQAALEELFEAGNVEVRDAAGSTVHIEFIGDLAGITQELLTATALNPPPGDLTFTLELDRQELAARLRREATVTLPLSVMIETPDDNDVQRWREAFRTNLVITRPLVWPDMALVPGVDWLRPLSPKDYLGFNPETVITGQQFYPEEIGNGVATTFVIDHGLATDVVHVWVREAGSGGMQLIEGTDYEVEITDADSVTVTALSGAPSTDEWLVTVVSAQTVAAFANDLAIDIDQVTGLQALLDAIGEDIEALQALAPSTPLGSTAADSAPSVTITFPDLALLFPGTGTLAELPRAGGLLPAIHDATVTAISALPLPTASAAAGNVYRNDTAAAILVPGGLGARSSYLAIGEYAGSDGRRFYPLSGTYVEQGAFTAATNDTCTRAGHALADGTRVRVSTTGELPGGLSALRDYFIRDAATDTFKLALTSGGSAVDITSIGSGTHTLAVARTSFHPRDFERTLWFAEINDAMLRAGTTLRADFKLAAQLLQATSRASYDLVIEHGVVLGQSTPATTAGNLESIAWDPTPLLSRRIILGETKVTHGFGAEIIRASGGTLSANKIIYGFTAAADSTPASANVALRARLVNFDTENSDLTARGTISITTSEGVATVS